MGLFKRVTDTAAEVHEHRNLTRRINQQVQAGDTQAAQSFHTGTLSAALTTTGRNARGAEVTDYVTKTLAADGNGARLGWLHSN